MPLYDLRQRRDQIRDKLLAIGLHIPLLCDEMFENGWLSEQQWTDLHLFRYDQVILRDAAVRRSERRDVHLALQDRKAGLAISRDRKAGFRMPNSGMLRAVTCCDRMDPPCYDVAMILVGLKEGEAERMEAVNAAWQVGQIYRGNGGVERWRD